MRFKLDENIPEPKLWFSFENSDVDTTLDEGLNGASDQAVFEAICRDDRFLITFDLDFADVRRFVPGTHPGIIVLRMSSPSRLSIMKRLREVFEKAEVQQWVGCTVIVSENRVRIRRAETGS